MDCAAGKCGFDAAALLPWSSARAGRAIGAGALPVPERNREKRGNQFREAQYTYLAMPPQLVMIQAPQSRAVKKPAQMLLVFRLT